MSIAEQALKGANEAIKAGKLFVNGVAVKSIHRGNVMQVFPPGIAEQVRRILRGY